MQQYRYLSDLTTHPDIKGLRVLLRVDLNVPVSENNIQDKTRILRTLPSIQTLSKAGAKTIILSHFGRPKGQVDIKCSLKPLATIVSNLLQQPVDFIEECIGDTVKNRISSMKNGDVLLLENTRFHKEEEENDIEFTKTLADLGDVFVNDAFSVAHRYHASSEGLAHLLPAYTGVLMQEELKALRILEAPESPFLAVIGGSKVSTKLPLLYNMIKKVDCVIIGGAMANTFLAAQNVPIGTSYYEPELLETAKELLSIANKNKHEILLPQDAVIHDTIEQTDKREVVDINNIPETKKILDLGDKSIANIKAKIKQAKMVIWNGPLGVFEVPPFDRATIDTARFVATQTKQGKLISVAGGGETVYALSKAQAINDFTYVSTAGGAFLEWLEGKTLPAIKALQDNYQKGIAKNG